MILNENVYSDMVSHGRSSRTYHKATKTEDADQGEFPKPSQPCEIPALVYQTRTL